MAPHKQRTSPDNSGLGKTKTDSGSVKFTSSAAIESIEFKDDTVEILAYVDALELPKTVGKDRKLTVLKFVLNNGAGKRVQCLAWQDQVERVKNILELNKIIHLNEAVSKEMEKSLYKYNRGNVGFELSIQQHTEIEANRGYYGLTNKMNVEPETVPWKDLENVEGRLIEISGWLKMTFKMTHHKSGNSAYAVGAMTDGKMKLGIRIASFDDLPSNLKTGCAIRVIGVMHYDNLPYIKVTNGSRIIITEKPPLNADMMHDITSTPNKKARKSSNAEVFSTLMAKIDQVSDHQTSGPLIYFFNY